MGNKAKYWNSCWNPVIGCYPVSEGCQNCYAKKIVERFGINDGCFVPILEKEKKPPKSGVVFVGNMTDIFGDWNTDGEIINWMCSLSVHAENLVLTKRVERMARLVPVCWNPSIHLGMTAENQERYDERIGNFRTIYSHGFKWLSAEPLLGAIDMQLEYIAPEDIPFSWVVVGSESGSQRRPCKLEWIESIVDQCKRANVPVFVKQIEVDGKFINDINQFPEHLRIREFPWSKENKA